MIMHHGPMRCVLLSILALTLLGAGSVSAQVCVEGTVTAEYQSSGPFAGMWLYTMGVSWTTGSHALSHLTFDLDLEACPCICQGIFDFDTPAGTSNGEPEPCTVQYAAEFVCAGDPTLPEQNGPALKWEAITPDCEPGATGTGTFTFYSLLGPGPAGPPSGDNLWVKFGQLNCSGLLTGQLPICDGCATPVEQTTWGAIKSTF